MKDLYAKLEQLLLAEPTCEFWLLSWAQEGLAGRREELGYGSRTACKSRIRDRRTGVECYRLALEIDDALRAEKRAKADDWRAARQAVKEALRQERLAKRAAREAAQEARHQERLAKQAGPDAKEVSGTVVGVMPAPVDLDVELEEAAAERQRKAYWARSEGQRAKLAEMECES